MTEMKKTIKGIITIIIIEFYEHVIFFMPSARVKKRKRLVFGLLASGHGGYGQSRCTGKSFQGSK